ncbi:hypothetical protein GGI07_000637 [Coemansia sp. Benny D115]|nr:hypothetical protein GGI07_000637 [Coemansia sp. Benny D115]
MNISVVSIVFCALFMSIGVIAGALSFTQMDAIELFLEKTNSVSPTGKDGPTKEEIAHDLAVGLGLKNSASLLYKYSPDAKTAYSTMYDSLVYLSVSGFSTPAQKKEIKKVIKYFETDLLH